MLFRSGYIGLLGLVGKAGAGCDPTADSGTIPTRQKYWNPSEVSMRLVECYTDYKSRFTTWATNNGYKVADLTDTELMQWIVSRVTDGLNEAKLRHIWFGDTDAANVDDDGVVTDGVDVKYLNAIDGIWKQLFAIVTGDNTRKSASIAKNAGNSYANQKFNSTDTTNKVVHGYLQACIDDADLRLSDAPDKVFYVTKSVFDQYKKELKNYTSIEAAYQLVQDGSRQLMFDGVPVIPLSFWDRHIKAYFDNGTTTDNPHRILLTTKANLMVGIESEEAINGLDVFYDKVKKNNITDALFTLDAKVSLDYMVQLAY